MKKTYLIVAALVAGYLIMSLELLGSRIMAPYFGNSIYVWGNLIGLILAALTIGYYLGGYLADKKNNDKLFIYLFLATAVFLILDLFVYKIILNKLAAWGIIWGSIAGVCLLFLPSMIVLAAVAPLAIKLLAQDGKIGRASGLIYAWGTIGSLLGTFLTVFLFIPYFGSKTTLFICFLISLMAFSVLLLIFGGKKKVVFSVIILFVSFLTLPKTALPQRVILETESIYNQIRLVDYDKAVYLTTNSNKFYLIQSAYIKEGTLFNFSLIDLYNLGPYIAPVKNLLILGMSSGASVRQHQQFAPDVHIDAVEIDPKVIGIAKNQFGTTENTKLKIFQADARPYLTALNKKYDMVEIDLFQGSPYIPFYVLTQEFFQAVYNHLNDSGIFMMNIYAPAKHELLAPVLATVAAVFPSVYSIPIMGDNFVMLASRSFLGVQDIKDKILQAQDKISPDLKPASNHLLNYIELYQADKKMPIFTDDWAPTELITYQMLKGVPELN